MRFPPIRLTLLLTLLLLSGTEHAWAQTDNSADIPPNVLPIYAVQGDGLASPLVGEYIDAYGLVTGVTDNGFYLQDPLGDGDPETSDGIFVYTSRPPQAEVGQCLLVMRAFVDEYYEKTELSRAKTPEVVDYCASMTVEPVDIVSARMATPPEALFEQVEGMVVRVDDLHGVVSGPTKRFADGSAELALVPDAFAPYLPDGRVFQWDGDDKAALMYVSSALGDDLPQVNWGDRVSLGGEPGDADAVTAILDYNFGKYQLLPLPGATIEFVTEQQQPDAVASGPAAADDFTVCTFNVLGMGDGTAQYPDEAEYAAQLQKRALAIAESLQGCTIIGMQEAGTPEDVQNLADLLRTSHGLDYTATAIEGPGTSSFEFPLTNGLLTRNDRVEVLGAELPQGCSKFNYDVKYIVGACERGTYGLFNRPPLVVDLAVSGPWGNSYPLTVISNHWKSKGGNEEVNVVRRTAQAEHVASLVQAKLDADPDANVVVLGDLNDYYVSGPVTALRTGVDPDMVHTFDALPDLNRYTYIFNGASQVLDHILVTDNMTDVVTAIEPVRINADYVYPITTDPTSVHHSSDHDPVLMRVQPEAGAWVGGNVQFPGIGIELFTTDDTILVETVTDGAGDFRLWDVTPGEYQLRFVAPAAVSIDPPEQVITVIPGANIVEPLDANHRTAILGAALAGAWHAER